MRSTSLAVIAAFVLFAFASAEEVTPLDLTGDATSGAVVAEGCMGCHGPDGHTARTNTPHLAGQYEEYLKAELWKFKTGQREHGAMNRIAGNLSVEEIADVAAYWASQPWGEEGSASAD